MTPTAASPPDADRFLESMASPDPAVRRAAAAFARRRGPGALTGLADLAASSDKAVAKAAQKAMADLTHHAARPGAPTEARQVSGALLTIAQTANRPRAVRAQALHLLGFVATDVAVPVLRSLLADPQVADDARMTLSRVGTRASRDALATTKPRAAVRAQRTENHAP